MSPTKSRSVIAVAKSARHRLPGAIAVFLLCSGSLATEPQDIDRLLKHADTIKSSDHAQFTTLVEQLDKQQAELSQTQAQYLKYLHGWEKAYDGRYSDAVPILAAVLNETADITLRFRAAVTAANVLVLAKQHEKAFSQLDQLLIMLPTVTDQDARVQGLSVTAYLYNQVGEFGLGSRYAQTLIDENASKRGACYGRQLKLEAVYKGSKSAAIGPEYQDGIDVCNDANELSFSNVIRTYVARLLIDQSRPEDAIKLLNTHYSEVVKSQYPRLISEYESLFALAYRQKGEPIATRQFALRAIASAVKDEYTKPLVTAYQLLYLNAKERGEAKEALEYLEKYSAADKGYVDDLSTRQLAYQRVKHEVDANKLQIQALNKQNEVLSLQRSLADKAVENSRLYILMLVMGLAFVVYMAYRTKRSQLHFRQLSRVDGLTGISNRQHFIDQAQQILEGRKKLNQEACIMLCDLDHFKTINDTWGHAIGDDALKQTGAIFLTNLRKDDVVGRLGGEEFGILVVDCDANIAFQRCEQLRIALAEIVIKQGASQFTLSASFGIAMTATSGYDLRQLLANADAALYQAKSSGRNRVVQHDGKTAPHGEPSSGKGMPSTFALAAK